MQGTTQKIKKIASAFIVLHTTCFPFQLCVVFHKRIFFSLDLLLRRCHRQCWEAGFIDEENIIVDFKAVEHSLPNADILQVITSYSL